MRTPVEWLAEYVALPAGSTANEVADALLRVGFEVEEIHTVPVTTGDLVVGQVLTIEELTEFKKPIRFVSVDVGAGHGPNGSDGPREIICGARNFAVGDKVVIALPGSVLPGGFAIASRSTYGHVSDGMICSVRELGIGTEHDGILVIDADTEIGIDARDLIGSHDATVELAVTPDRGYALSIRGLAREVGAALDVPFKDPAAVPVPERAGAGWPVTIADPGCGRFVTVRVHGIDPRVPSPFWIRRRLQAAGIRSISLAVDVTNYVMIELGHPLHAFDAGKLNGEITVRRAATGETLKTLDGTVRTLGTQDLVVTDQSGPISMAGIMGGETTEISPSTTDVVIEAAHWDPVVISRAARRHKLPSEASRRFERGVDPGVSAIAAEAAAQLLTRYAGGSVVGRSDVLGTLPVAPVISLPAGEPARLAGRPYEVSAVVRRLEQVGCSVADPTVDPLQVTPPSWRPDLTRAADLVEEVVRLEDYATIPSILPGAPAGKGLTSSQRRERRISDDLAAAGLTEVLAFPFVGIADFDALGLPADDVRRFTKMLVNPLDADRPAMRTTLLPGLLDAVTRNISRGARDLSFYEIGQVFLPSANAPEPAAVGVDRRPTDAELQLLDASLPLQPRHIAVVLAGAFERAGWWGKGSDGSWADAIEIARRIGLTAGVDLRVVPAAQAPWHPGRCASVLVGDWIVGYAGELHPEVVERLGLPARSAALEIDLDALPERATPIAPRISPFPPVHLDVALVVRQEVLAQHVTDALLAGGGELLESVRLFDVYSGDQVAAGSKSLAFALVIRAADRTLTAVDAVVVRDAAVQEAAARTGAALR
jgi:phenylalanyl-tRNA synthetase beta chain